VRGRVVSTCRPFLRATRPGFLVPNDRLTSFDRLEIYNRRYWYRVLASMAEDFPGLRAILGQWRFDVTSYFNGCGTRSARRQLVPQPIAKSARRGKRNAHSSLVPGRLPKDMITLRPGRTGSRA
jgi:hypothetical protein